MRKITFGLLTIFCLAAYAAAPRAIDRGPLPDRERHTPISITVALSLPGLAEAERFEQALYTPGTPEYHMFLTSDQFAARFAPSDADIAKLVAAFAKYGLAAEKTTAITLKVTGMPDSFEQAFSTALHQYEVPARNNLPGYVFRAPATSPAVPAEMSSAVTSVFGLDNRPAAHSHHRTPPSTMTPSPSGTAPTRTGKTFGNLTVLDVAELYDVNPLYAGGITGKGRTIGIMTLASFTPSDAFAYWAALGLTVNPNRITVVNVDGGPGVPSDASGSFETALDVEQSGGLAPGANIIVYQAPNTPQGFIDLFAAAIEANKADSLSVSWGLDEPLTELANSPVTDPLHGTTVDFITAAHELFLRAAIQGQTVFAASGDGGAYDVNQDLGCFGPYDPSVKGSCSLTLTVDYPASDTFITGAGGTTLGGHQRYCLSQACTPPLYQIEIAQESVWGWDYLTGLCKTLGFDPISCGTFPGGSGGGVSVFFPAPSYQSGLPGIQLSQPAQNLYWQPFGLLDQLPAFFAGRNVPDISLNADPDSGYVLYYTSDKTGFGAQPFAGGTSFVAPQLAGITALFVQDVNKRIGLLNPTLYGLAASGQAYGGSKAPLNQITSGDNWFYSGSKGYNPGTGLGTIDAANLAAILRSQF
jgi:subtilase family serine protease